MIRWSYAFIDRLDRTAETFWRTVTDAKISPRRGESGQFATLLPGDGHAYVKTQTVGEAPGAHLDLSVDDIADLTSRAVGLGARVVTELDDVTVLASPAGAPFCAVAWEGETGRPEPVDLAGGRTRLDQICVDVSPADYEAEFAFWAALTGWESGHGSLPGFGRFKQPPGLPLRILVQRLDEPGPARMHLDFACRDIDAARDAHVAAGAGHVQAFPFWHVMRDPAGVEYCLTGRDPDTGDLRRP
ncbi:VOC family protein [Phytomonospora sp. NPDC050363]|uniref:VOC family protein n=1 Tax=Phytomonospora sp. NPDC050363 TaxID=3155642 RepID=UPI0033CDF21C